MGDGTEENPYTREDVLRLKEENRRRVGGLGLSGKVFETEIDLRKLDLSGIILKEAHLSFAHLEEAFLIDADLEVTNLMNAHLEGTHLLNAHLERANLVGVNFKMANLSYAHLEGADLRGAYLEGAYFAGVKLSSETMLENADWGNHVLGEEKEHEFDLAEDTYRRLKQWYTEHGLYDVAGKFFYREMEAKRKAQSWKKKPASKLWSWVIRLLCGYGEKPLKVIGWAASVVLCLAFIYFIIGSVWEWSAFWNSLYFSAVSFTALGYGSWVNTTNDWIRGIGAFESFIGVFTIALFLVTFVRKWTR